MGMIQAIMYHSCGNILSCKQLRVIPLKVVECVDAAPWAWLIQTTANFANSR